MGAFVHHLLLYSGESIEDDSSSAAFHIVHSCLAERNRDEDWDGPF